MASSFLGIPRKWSRLLLFFGLFIVFIVIFRSRINNSKKPSLLGNVKDERRTLQFKSQFNYTLKFDHFIEKLEIEQRPTILAESRFVKVNGFAFCDILDGSSFDTMIQISAFKGHTLAEENPDMSEFINLIDGKAYEIFEELMLKFHLAHQQEAKRISCYVAAEGSSSIAALTSSRLLRQVNGQNYFKDIIPSVIPTSEVDTQKKHYKIAYLFMVHEKRGFQQLCTTLELLDDGDAIILIHVDARTQSNEFFGLIQTWIRKRKDIRGDSAIHLAKKRFSNIWGHISLVFTQLSGFWELLDIADWDYIINVSNYDYPLVSNNEMHTILRRPETAGKNFIQYWTDTSDLAERFNRAHLGEADYSTVYHSPELGILSTPYPSWRAYKHHQWVIFTPEAVRFFRTDPDALNFLSFAEHTFIPDEHYFGTVMINSPAFKGKIINDNKRYLRFTGGAHPSWLGFKDRHLFPPGEPVPSFFFIRKFNSRGELFGERDLINWIQTYHFKKKKAIDGPIPSGKCTVEQMSVRKECFKEIGSTVAVKDSVVVIPVNLPFLAAAKNLMCSLARLGVNNVIFWALDLDVYELLLKQDKLAILMPGMNPLPDLQSKKSSDLINALRSKPKLLKYILESGLSIWILDADVVAVKDFTAIQDATTDIFVSLDGYLISSSVVFYRSNNRTLRFLNRVQSELDRSSNLDDENALRRVLLQNGTAQVLPANHEKLFPSSTSSLGGSPGKMKRSLEDPRVRYLDSFSFISASVFEKNPQSIPPGFKDFFTLHANEEQAKKLGYWFVDDDGVCSMNMADPPPLYKME